MNSRISFLLLLAPALAAGLLRAQAPDASHPAAERHRQAREAAAAEHERNVDALVGYYTSFLDTRAKETQSRGELEPLLLILAERKTVEETRAPGEGDLPPDLLESRKLFGERLTTLRADHTAGLLELDRAYLASLDGAIRSLTRQGRMEEAQALDRERNAMEARIAGAGSPPPDDSETAIERLGPNLLTNGGFDDTTDDGWRVSAPGGRNKTGIHQERNSGMNRTLRFEQHPDRSSAAHRHIDLKPGTTYRVTWRARLLRPWKSDVMLRGKGTYQIGFRIPSSRWTAFTPLEQEKFRHRVEIGKTPPEETEWREFSGTLTPREWMKEMFIHVSEGEGEFLIDDIAVREILPQEPSAKP